MPPHLTKPLSVNFVVIGPFASTPNIEFAQENMIAMLVKSWIKTERIVHNVDGRNTQYVGGRQPRKIVRETAFSQKSHEGFAETRAFGAGLSS